MTVYVSRVTTTHPTAQRPRQRALRHLGFCVAVLVHLQAAPSFGQSERIDGEDPSDREMQAEAPDRPRDMPLSLLPEPPSERLPSPRPAAIEALDELLKKITDTDAVRRGRAAQALIEAKTDWTSAIERRMDQLADKADRQAMKALFEKIRASSKDPTDGSSGDYLDDILAQPDPSNQVWRDLVQLFSMSRMLTAIATHEAARTLVFEYARFGEFVRIDVQRQFDELGDRATATLIETQRHPAPKIAEWASRLLRLRKQDVPHDAVKTKDSVALADILVALGRSRDPEVAGLLLSYAASDQPGVQKAARQGIALLGDVGAWQLKDAYLNITGKTPPRDWTWKRTARELFTEYDRLRLEEAYALFDQGHLAEQKQDWAKMAESYDKLIAKLPSFPKKNEVAAGYLRAATEAHRDGDGNGNKALLLAVKAEQLAEEETLRKKSEALRRLLSAERMKEQGWLDTTEIKRARQLNPELDVSSDDLSAEGQDQNVWGATARYLVAFAVLAVSVLGAVWIFASTFARRKTYQVSPHSSAAGPESVTGASGKESNIAKADDAVDDDASAASDDNAPTATDGGTASSTDDATAGEVPKPS